MSKSSGVTSASQDLVAGEDASSILPFELPRPGEYVHPDTLIVQVGDQLLFFSGCADTWGMPRCVARAKKGRCKQSIEHAGGMNGWNEWAVGDRFVEALDPGSTPDDAFIRQRCRTHLKSDAPDVVAPDWERFDPARHKRFLHRHRAPAWRPEGLPLGRDSRPTSHARPEDGSGDPEHESLGELLDAAIANRVEPSATTALYRYYDDQDRLLYVGITDNLFFRTASHAESSTWMDFAARSTIERYPTRKEAEKTEREAIKAEQPLFNAQHNSTPEAQKRLVEYLIEHGRTDLLVATISRG